MSVIYVKVPVDEAPRFESRLPPRAGALEEARLREQMALMEPEGDLGPGTAEAGGDPGGDGPGGRVGRAAWCSTRSAAVHRRGPQPRAGIIDLLPGAQHIIPAIMANLRAEDRRPGPGPEKVGPGLAAHRGALAGCSRQMR